MAANEPGQEELFLLRVADQQLAARLRNVLREQESLDGNIQLLFEDASRKAKLFVDSREYPVTLLDLPTVVESYKTYDDNNLVKIGDIGQMLLVGGKVAPDQVEAVDGVTPPMRKARLRHLRERHKIDPAAASRVESALVAILSGHAPQDMEITDYEEEYVVDAQTGIGSWKQVKGRNTQ